MNSKIFKFFDIASNLTDDQFHGIYHGKKYHDPDIDSVFQRAHQIGCSHFLIAAGILHDSKKSYAICQRSENSYLTVGIHPCYSQEAHQIVEKTSFESYVKEMEDFISQTINSAKGRCVAIGECGLDYDRFHYSSKEIQNKYFPLHFQLAHKFNLPMYLHNRNTEDDFYNIVKANRHLFKQGVVHSFTGTEKDLNQMLELDLMIGINGCGLKTAENLEVVKKIPLERLMLETDSPYCDIKKTHDSYKFIKTEMKDVRHDKYKPNEIIKNRNEPCKIIQVLEVLAAVRNQDMQLIADTAFENSIKFFNV